MSTKTSLGFIQKLRDTMDLLGRLVWESHALGLRRDGEWPESEFFAALINQGFGKLDKRAKAALDELEEARPYRVKFECARHHQQTMEPITGADLGVAVSVVVNGTLVSRRGLLVQLKKATIDVAKKTVQFDDLHHESGKRIFGRKMHQAERMLLFTNAAVYWLAVPPGAEADDQFFQKYVQSTNFARRRDLRSSVNADSSGLAADGDSPFAPWGSLPWVTLPEFDYLLERWQDFIGHRFGPTTKSLLDQYRQREGERLLRSLRSDAATEPRRLYGMRSLIPILCSHAESVLALRQRKTRSLSDLCGVSVSLPEFILGDVVADGFGDDNAELVNAILTNRPNDFIRDVARSSSADPDANPQVPVVKEAVQVQIAVEVANQPDQQG